MARTTIADKKEIKEGLQFVASGFLIKLEEIISGAVDNKEVKQEVKQAVKQEPIVSSTGELFIDDTGKISKSIFCPPSVKVRKAFVSPLASKDDNEVSRPPINDVYSRNRDLSNRNYGFVAPSVQHKTKIEESEEPKRPPAKKTKASIFNDEDDSD